MACASSKTAIERRRSRGRASRRSAARGSTFRRGLRAQRGVGGEQDAFLERDRRALAEARQRHDVGAIAADRVQSRSASSMSLSDLEIQTARRRPLSQLSRMIAATWRPLPAPVPSPRNQPRRKRTASSAPVRRGGNVVSFIDGVSAGEMTGMGLAGIDNAFELRVGQDAARKQPGRQMRPVGRARRCNRCHGSRLHQLGRVRTRHPEAGSIAARSLRKGSSLKRVSPGRPVAGFINKLDNIRGRGRAFNERQLRCGCFRPHRCGCVRRKHGGGEGGRRCFDRRTCRNQG